MSFRTSNPAPHHSIVVTVVLVLAALVVPGVAGAAPGDLDPTFGSGGKFTQAVGSGSSNINAAVVQADGKIVVAGSVQVSGGNFDFLVGRLNANGTLDGMFNPGGTPPGVVSTPIHPLDTGFDVARAVALGPGGTIYVAGTTNPPGMDPSDFAVVRYTSVGALDTNFSGDGIQTHSTAAADINADRPRGVAVQDNDGKVLVAGTGGEAGGCTCIHVLRLDPTSGALDPTYNNAADLTPGIAEIDFTGDGRDTAYALALQGDGKAVVGGTANELSATNPDFALARLNVDGTLDTAGFGAGTGKVQTGDADSEQAFALALVAGIGAPDGPIMLAGRAGPTGASGDFMLARYTADGTPDGSFSDDGIETTPFPAGDGTLNATANAVAVQADDKILAGGSARTCAAGCRDFAAARYLPNGALDSAFADAGKRTYPVGTGNDVANAAVLANGAGLGYWDLFGACVDGLEETCGIGISLEDAPPATQPAPSTYQVPPPRANLRIQKRLLTQGKIEQGDLVRFEIEVENPGTVTESYTFADIFLRPIIQYPSGDVKLFPESFKKHGADLPQGCTLLGPTLLLCRVPNMLPKEKRRFVVALRPADSGDFVNRAAGDLFDPTTASDVRIAVNPKTGVVALAAAAASVNAKGIGKVAAECHEPRKDDVCVAILNVFLEQAKTQSTGATVARLARKRKRTSKGLGTVKGRIPAGRRGRLRIALNRKGRRQLSKAGTMTVRLRGYSTNRRGKRRKVDTELILHRR